MVSGTATDNRMYLLYIIDYKGIDEYFNFNDLANE